MFENNFHRAGHDKKTTQVEKENNKIQKYDVRYAETSKNYKNMKTGRESSDKNLFYIIKVMLCRYAHAVTAAIDRTK